MREARKMKERDQALLERAQELSIQIPGNWGNKRIKQEIDRMSLNNQLASTQPIHNTTEAADNKIGMTMEAVLDDAKDVAAEAFAITIDKFTTLEWANERAAMIWNGQSPNLSILERVGRIKFALKDKGFSDFERLVIPTNQDYKRYL